MGIRLRITGDEIKKLMRQNKKTISALSEEMGITKQRVRDVRKAGVKTRYVCRDWMEALAA